MRFVFNTTFENPGFALSYDKLIDNAREQACLSEEAGFDAYWLAEHHFGANGRDNLPNPFLLAADLGSRTTRIRFGTAVVVLPLWHPLRVAENIAMLDQMLKGRLEIGFGRASQPHEVVTFNPAADPRVPAGSRAVFAEALEVVKKALTQDFFSHSGEHYELPPAGVSWSSRKGFEDDPRWIRDGEVYRLHMVPGPYQKPHPPFWMAISTEGSAQVAAELDLKPVAWRQTARKLREWIAKYQAVRRSGGDPCPNPGGDWGVLRQIYVAPTMEAARRDYEALFVNMMRYRAADPWRAIQAFLDPGEEAPSGAALDWDFLWNRCLIAGSPQDVVEQIQELQELTGAGTLAASFAHEGLPQDKVLQCIELLGERVIPEIDKAGAQDLAAAGAG